MMNPKDSQRIEKCYRLLKLKSIDYGIKTFPEEFFEELKTKAKLYGDQLNATDKFLRDSIFNSIKSNNLSVKDDTALAALEILKKNVHDYCELTDTFPKAILKMTIQELFDIVQDFEDEEDNIKIVAYVLGQYKIKSSSESTPDEDEDEEETDDDEDWFDKEEEEDDENQFISDRDEYK